MPVDQIEYGEELMGPGWLMFFRTQVRVIPARGGSGSAAHGAEDELTIRDPFEDDFIDILALLALNNII